MDGDWDNPEDHERMMTKITDAIQRRRNDPVFMARLAASIEKANIPIGTDDPSLIAMGATALGSTAFTDMPGYVEGICTHCGDPIYTTQQLGVWLHGATLHTRCDRTGTMSFRPATKAAPGMVTFRPERPTVNPSWAGPVHLESNYGGFSIVICNHCGTIVADGRRQLHQCSTARTQ